MKKRATALLLALLMILPMAGCGVRAQELTKDIEPQALDTTTDLTAGGEAVTAFALSLLRSERAATEGVLISPVSVLNALGMVANGAGGDTPDGFSPGGAPAPAVVAEAVFLVERVIGVTGTVIGGNLAVVFGLLVAVEDDKRDRGAGRLSFKHARENLYGVVLFARRCISGLTGLAPVEKLLDIRLTERKSRRTAVDDDADALSVRFPPGCNFKKSS